MSKSLTLKSQILKHVESAAQRNWKLWVAKLVTKNLKAIEAKYNALHVEFFDSEEEAPEMDPALVEELEVINKVKILEQHSLC